jgi:hypothetical protein
MLKSEGSETTETLRARFVQALELFSCGLSNAWKIKKGRADWQKQKKSQKQIKQNEY